jgi:hypothetical protein
MRCMIEKSLPHILLANCITPIPARKWLPAAGTAGEDESITVSDVCAPGCTYLLKFTVQHFHTNSVCTTLSTLEYAKCHPNCRVEHGSYLSTLFLPS